jgi:3-deoxy-manno-octulosonate cytidylyltransferase (CMP-KDO synthetase)
VYIATCDKEIEEYCLINNIKVVMTKNTHQRASDRTAEAMLKIEQSTGEKIDIVVMIQGDEPMFLPQMIDAAVTPIIKDHTIQVVNLMSPLKNTQEYQDPNTVKVVMDKMNFALYFSREPIPSRKKGAKEVPMFKQVCIIPFRRDFLITFNKLHPTPLEIVESVDMLRILEHGFKVKMVMSNFHTYSVDTRLDLKRVEKLLTKDKLLPLYTRNI